VSVASDAVVVHLAQWGLAASCWLGAVVDCAVHRSPLSCSTALGVASGLQLVMWLAKRHQVLRVEAWAAFGQWGYVVDFVSDASAAVVLADRVVAKVVGADGAPVSVAAWVGAAFECWAALAGLVFGGGFLASVADAGWCCGHGSPGPDMTKPPGLEGSRHGGCDSVTDSSRSARQKR
jgi:hypothetical protein